MNIEEARWIRQERGVILSHLSVQILYAEDVLRDRPQVMAGCPIGKLLKATRHLGETRVRTVLTSTGIDYNQKVGTLDDKQIQGLIDHLPLAARRRKE